MPEELLEVAGTPPAASPVTSSAEPMDMPAEVEEHAAHEQSLAVLTADVVAGASRGALLALAQSLLDAG